MRSISVLIPLVLSAIATGQQPSLTCLSDVGVYAKNGSRLYVKSIPKSTAITKATKLTVGTIYVANSATMTATPTISQKTSTFVFREQAWVNAPANYYFTSGAGTATRSPNQPHSWLIKVPANTAGNVLLVTMSSTRNPKWLGVVQRAQLDIGNDNSLEIDQDLTVQSATGTFNLGTKAVDIRIVTHGDYAAKHVGGYDFEVGLTLNPDGPLKISSYGPMCGMKLGMTSAISGSGHMVSVSIQGGFFGSGSILMLGLAPTAIPFPGTPCTILVNPLMSVRLPDKNGSSLTSFYVPGRIDGVIYLQSVSAYSAYGLTNFRMSNGIKVDGG